ncbi:cilia- and flagella-associated protein 46 isoform 2-T2 [Syngnathus typhle]
MDLDVLQYLAKAKKKKDSGALQSAFNELEEMAEADSGGTLSFDRHMYIYCAEVALELGCFEIAATCLKRFFADNPPPDQYLCRALLCQSRLKVPPPTGNMGDFKENVQYLLKAMDISKREKRSHYLVFNASVLYLQMVRPLLQPGRCCHLVSSLRQVVKSLELVADKDHSWRAQLMIHHAQCVYAAVRSSTRSISSYGTKYLIDSLLDAGKSDDAASYVRVTEEFVRKHCPHLLADVFRLQVWHNMSKREILLKKSRQSATLTVIFKMLQFKRWLGEIKEEELAKKDLNELEEILSLLGDSTKASLRTPIPPAERVVFLLELALLALQGKNHKMAEKCFKKLKPAGDTSFGEQIIMECINCEIELRKKETKTNDYSKSSVEARLKAIGKLDQCLLAAVRERDPQAVQAVCATQWSFCLPLLQHNLRQHVKTPMLRMAQTLEDMQCMLFLVRSQVHAELAASEEEDGLLEASMTHLRKAMLLDNGTQKERLSSAFHLLQLRRNLYQTPSRTEDKAAMLMQQVKDRQPQPNTDCRPLLLTVGQLLAPADFQMVLNADSISKITKASVGCGPIAQLSAEAHNYYAAVQKLDGYLDRQGENADNTERLSLWATLAKTARKQEVWDVCRVAGRFCLLYDEARAKMSICRKSKCSEEESSTENLNSYEENQPCAKKLRLLAEICFITAEATAQKLQMQGVQLNSPAVLPQDVGVSEDDPHWIIYRDWIQDLSAYATSTFLRAAELGTQIREPWIVANSAIYLWNYNRHLLVTGDYNCLIPTFQKLVEMFQKTQCTGNHALVVLLCDAVARGLYEELALPVNMGKVQSEKTNDVLDPDALLKVHKAFELCNYALSISHGTAGEAVPIAVQKQLVATWAQIKILLQQQAGCQTDIGEKSPMIEEMSPITRVLIAVEMLQSYKNSSSSEGYDPSLSALVSMVSQCKWTDAVVELQTWCQLAAFCLHAKEYTLALSCTERAMDLEEAASKCLNTTPCLLYGLPAVNEMLSTAACLRGLSSIHQSIGDVHIYKRAMDMLLSSIRYAQKAGHSELCFTAARHYWNNCLPLTHSPEERHQLKEPVEAILNALLHTYPKHTNKQDKVKNMQKGVPLGSSKPEAPNEEVLTLRSSLYCLLLQIYIDRADCNGALQLLDNAVRDMPATKHRLFLLKCRIQIKARLGESVLMDMQTLQGKEEHNCSLMWHKAALCSCHVTQQLTCYQKSVTSLRSEENQWQKVSFLLAFGAWMFCHNLSTEEAQHQVQWAIDILLHLETEQSEKSEEDSQNMGPGSVKCETLAVVQGLSFTQTVSNLREVQRLDSLVQAHTLLAVMADRNSPEHQLNLLRAYDFVLQIWQMSAAVVSATPSEQAKGQNHTPVGNKKDKGKGKKVKDPTPPAVNPKPDLDSTLLSTLEFWVKYTCSDQVRYTFKTNCNPQCINIHSITNQSQSLFYLDLLVKELDSLSLSHLTLPVLHLAETFAHDLLDRKSLSDLYRLRIVRTCCQLGMETDSSYHKTLMNLTKIQEQEQITCHGAITLSQERKGLYSSQNQESDTESHLQRKNLFGLNIWVDKAEVCLEMGLYQGARQLLAEAQLVALEFKDQTVMPRILLGMAALACEEHNYVQSLYLLDKAQALGGDEYFWHKFTLTKLDAVLGQSVQDAQAKIDQIVKQGCEALTVVLKRRVNRVSEITFLMTSLEMRGAIESLSGICVSEPGVPLSTQELHILKAACDTLGQCARLFTQLNYREQAAKSHEECTYGLRFLANKATDKKEKQRFLLDAFSHMQLAILEEEHVVLNAENLLHLEEASCRVILSPKWTLLRLRLSLTDVCLAILEEHCEEIVNRALVKDKSTAEIAIEDFMRSIPETNSIEQEWLNVGSTLGQTSLCQLAAVNSCSLDDMEMRARFLSLMGKTLRLLAVQEDPLYMSSLWDRHLKEGTRGTSNTVTEDNLGREKESTLSSNESKRTSAKSTEPQQKKCKVEHLLAQAKNLLSQTVSLCLEHNLPASILSDASLNMLECLGQSDHDLACQYLALFQSACTVDVMADVLNLACDDISVSQLSALLSLYRKVAVSQEGRATKVLEGVRRSLNSISKAFSQLTINPNHLQLLAELSSDLKIILLQHSKDGRELYGALYKVPERAESQKGKTSQAWPPCSRVAKVSVCPRALLALREQTQAFDQKMRHGLLKESSLHDGRVQRPEEGRISQPRCDQENTLTLHFKEIVQQMEEYLNPLLSHFDFTFLSSQESTVSVSETTQDKSEEKKVSLNEEEATTKEFVVLLADSKLMELPLEALSVLEGDLLNSVSRDFSLQLLCSRIPKEEPVKVAEKEPKGGKGGKGKPNQNQPVKVVPPVSNVLPEHTVPVDTRNFKCIFNDKDIVNTFTTVEGTTLVDRMKMNWGSYGQNFNNLLPGFVAIKQTPSLSELETVLCKCSGFMYLGAEHFLSLIPPAKLAALNLPECHLALLFDLVQSKTSAVHSSNLDTHKRAGKRSLEKPLEVALLLSLIGVNCVVLNQWHSSLQDNSEYITNFLDNFLSGKQTCGQIVHFLRRDDDATGSNDHSSVSDSDEDLQHKPDLTPSDFNCVLYGLPNLTGT